MKLPKGPLFKWFGSKWRAAARYPTVPDDMQIFEPYAGCAGFSLKYAHHPVQIYDCNEALQILWPWLIGPATGDDIVAIPTGLEVGQDIRHLDLTPQQMVLLQLWQRVGRYRDTDAMWKVAGGLMGNQWDDRVRDRVARDIECVKHWKFAPVPFDARGYYLIDPPYLFNPYDYGTPFDYAEMVGSLCGTPSGSVIVCCESQCRETGARPDYLPFEESHTAVTMRGTRSTELLFVHPACDWRRNLGPPPR